MSAPPATGSPAAVRAIAASRLSGRAWCRGNSSDISQLVMAGLVPAIHVLQTINMAGGWVYILTNRRNGILYVGVTSDLVRRIFEHRSGFVDGFTKRYGLKRLVYFEQFDAIQRENNIKHWSRAWKVRRIVAMNP